MDVLLTNKRHLTRKNVDAAKKEKRYERNWISSNRSTKKKKKKKKKTP